MSSARSLSLASPAAASSSLLRLPESLFTLILTFLPLPCKFHTLTHLSHSSPRLTSSAFQHDHLDLSADCLRWINTRPSQTVALLTQLHSLTCVRIGDWNKPRGKRHPPTADLLSEVLQTLRSIPGIPQPFSSLRILCIRVSDTDDNETCRSLATTFTASLTHLPLLHTLCLAARRNKLTPLSTAQGVTQSSGWLSRLPSLTSLTLATWLDAHTLHHLFTLPLLYLDIRQCATKSRDHCEYTVSMMKAVSGTLRHLYLPMSRYFHYRHRGDGSYEAQLLRLYTDDANRQSGDEK
jgi:hypothetical protein